MGGAEGSCRCDAGGGGDGLAGAGRSDGGVGQGVGAGGDTRSAAAGGRRAAYYLYGKGGDYLHGEDGEEEEEADEGSAAIWGEECDAEAGSADGGSETDADSDDEVTAGATGTCDDATWWARREAGWAEDREEEVEPWRDKGGDGDG